MSHRRDWDKVRGEDLVRRHGAINVHQQTGPPKKAKKTVQQKALDRARKKVWRRILPEVLELIGERQQISLGEIAKKWRAELRFRNQTRAADFVLLHLKQLAGRGWTYLSRPESDWIVFSRPPLGTARAAKPEKLRQPKNGILAINRDLKPRRRGLQDPESDERGQ